MNFQNPDHFWVKFKFSLDDSRGKEDQNVVETAHKSKKRVSNLFDSLRRQNKWWNCRFHSTIWECCKICYKCVGNLWNWDACCFTAPKLLKICFCDICDVLFSFLLLLWVFLAFCGRVRCFKISSEIISVSKWHGLEMKNESIIIGKLVFLIF